MGSRGRRVVAALAVAAVLLGACSDTDDSDDNATVVSDRVETSETTGSTSSTTTTTTDPDAAVKAQVEEAYQDYLIAYLEIFASPNPENPLIEKHTTSAVRDVTLDAIARNVLDGTSTQPPDDPADYAALVEQVDVDGPVASLRACVIDGTVMVQTGTGAVLNDSVSTLHLDVLLHLEGGLWKVAESSIIGTYEGRSTCGS